MKKAKFKTKLVKVKFKKIIKMKKTIINNSLPNLNTENVGKSLVIKTVII